MLVKAAKFGHFLRKASCSLHNALQQKMYTTIQSCPFCYTRWSTRASLLMCLGGSTSASPGCVFRLHRPSSSATVVRRSGDSAHRKVCWFVCYCWSQGPAFVGYIMQRFAHSTVPVQRYSSTSKIYQQYSSCYKQLVLITQAGM